jgi:hypothetical protein
LLAALVFVAASSLGCSKAYYAALETVGFEKRHLLARRVEAGRDAQREAQAQFQTTLDRFKALTGFEGGELEARYRELSGEFERCEARAGEVRERIAGIRDVAEALFDEWESEIASMHDASLRRGSEQRLKDTRAQYQRLLAAMTRAEKKMDPVLTAFRDQVLYLKHNLNARAIASLEGNVAGIERDVDALVREMQDAIAEADRFVTTVEG